MKKVFVMFLLLSVFLSTQTVSAKMSIIPPQDMLNRSDYIVVGQIRKQITADHHRAVHKEITLSVEAVLKGEITQREIVLKRNVRFHPGEVPYDFPKQGTNVMLLLSNTVNGLSLTYHNSICIIRDNRLSLFEGTGFGDWSVKEYEDTYQAFYDSADSIKNIPPSSSDMRVFRLTANEVQSAHVKWGPRFHWMLTRNEIDSLLTILRKARKEDIKPYYGPMPKGGPFQVSLMTKSNEHFTFTVGAGGEGYVLCEGGKVFLPEFSDFMKPFKVRRANEAVMH